MIHDLQKANMWKRISAFLFDLILFFILVVGAAFAISAIVDYNAQIEKVDAIQTKYEKQYDINLTPTQEEMDKFTKEERATYDEARAALRKDTAYQHILAFMFNLTLIITTFSILIAYLILEFIIPLIFGNGQTLGKKIFGIALMRIDGVKLTPVQLFVRTILGKYTVETMIPVTMGITILLGTGTALSILVPIGILLVQVVLIFATPTHALIHDKFAGTVAVDMASQVIFDSVEDLNEYKKRLHEEAAASADYP